MWRKSLNPSLRSAYLSNPHWLQLGRVFVSIAFSSWLVFCFCSRSRPSQGNVSRLCAFWFLLQVLTLCLLVHFRFFSALRSEPSVHPTSGQRVWLHLLFAMIWLSGRVWTFHIFPCHRGTFSCLLRAFLSPWRCTLLKAQFPPFWCLSRSGSSGSYGSLLWNHGPFLFVNGLC